MKYQYQGLERQNVEASRKQHGSNQITPQETEGFLDKLLGNFKDPIILILVAALVINLILAGLGYAEWYEGVGIAIAVLVATLVATFSEHKNESSFQKLQEEASQICNKVFRDGILSEININDIVVGDYVMLQPGDKIPADGKLIKGQLKVSQAALTGEAEDVLKIMGAHNSQAADEDLLSPYQVFRGTVVSDGEAVMEVATVGDKTFYGQLAQELGDDDRQSPLQVKLSALAGGISKFGYIGATFIAFSFMFKKIAIDNGFALQQMMTYLTNWQVLLNDLVTAVILAIIIVVVAVPEGLPMMIALVLSLNMRKLLDNKVLVRKLIGIETAGSMNILFTDKTGTITKGQLEAVLFLNGSGQSYKAYEEIPTNQQKLLTLSIGQNTASVIGNCEKGTQQVIGGNPTERALLQYINSGLAEKPNTQIVQVVPFNSERKFSATQIKGDVNLTLVKGAPEIILDRCRYYYDENGDKQQLQNLTAIIKKIDQMADRAIRVVALATAEAGLADEQLPNSLNLVGIVGIRDDIRSESVGAIWEAQLSGIQVVMITGDRKETATAIASECGLLRGAEDLVLTSQELNTLTDERLQEILPQLRVVARALPTDKSRLVQVVQAMGMVVGMTGDGVNDAPALSKADVGFAMGSGTEVAKEAGDIVILDDNFSSITKAVLYGRTIFNSIRKFVVFQLTVNVAAILTAFLGPFLGFDLPLTMVQMLWVNLVMDTLAALAFGGEIALAKYMREKPKRRDESIINKDMWSAILTNGLAIAFLAIFFLKFPPVKGLFSSEAAFMTGFFAFFIFLNNFNKFNARTEEVNLFDHILENKGFLKVVGLIFTIQIIFTYLGGEVLRTVGLTVQEWIYVVVFSAVIIPIDLTRKMLRDLGKEKSEEEYLDEEMEKAILEQAVGRDD